MTDREKTELLARWMGYTITLPSTYGYRGLLLHDTSPSLLGERNYWWNPLRVVGDAMEIYERLACCGQQLALLAGCVDGAMIYRLDIETSGDTGLRFGPDCSTIPAAICEAVVEWLDKKEE